VAEHCAQLQVGVPAERAGPGEDHLVGLGAQDRVDHERLEPSVPGATLLGGAGVDLGGGEGDLAGVAADRLVHVGGVLLAEEVIDVGLDDLDREPHQVDGLLERDDAGQGTRRDAEHGRGQVRLGGVGGGAAGVPADELLDAGLDDQADQGAVLRGEVLEPRHRVVHARGGGRRQPTGRAPQRLRGALAGGRDYCGHVVHSCA
jgi:hypothetical protein